MNILDLVFDVIVFSLMKAKSKGITSIRSWQKLGILPSNKKLTRKPGKKKIK